MSQCVVSKTRSYRNASRVVVMAALIVWPGCTGLRGSTDGASVDQSLLPLMPRRIEIVRPFTVWADYDGKPGIDGIEVYVQALNAAGDPIQTAGTLYVELYSYRQAVADHRGERLGVWDFTLQDQADQDTRWNRATQMYEFPISLPQGIVESGHGNKVVLTVTHNPPIGGRHTDECTLEAPLGTSALTGKS